MRKQNGGFIFLMTLLMISIMSLLLTASMQHLLLYYQAINQLQKTHQRFYQLESLAMQLAKKPWDSFNKECVIEADAASYNLQQLIRHQGCILERDSNHYRYIIENLGDHPCLMALQNNKTVSTHHARVSILEVGKNSSDSLLQLRLITPIVAQACDGEKHTVPLGISSWRYLAAID